MPRFQQQKQGLPQGKNKQNHSQKETKIKYQDQLRSDEEFEIIRLKI